jgi:hypothetical protein
MVARLLSGILTAVFLPLGIVFLILGAATEEGFTGGGAAFAAVGLGCALTFAALMRAEAARRRRRRAGLRDGVEVVEATLRPGIRVGVYLTYDLTVRIDGQTVTQRVLVVPGTELKPGGTVEVFYDPADPANFEVAK